MRALQPLNQWILITGASSGIGACFARKFAAEGSSLILTARSTEKLRKLAGELESQFGIKTLCVAVDLSGPSAPRTIFQEVRKQGIVLTGLVNNAGCGTGGRFVEVSIDRYLKMIDLNVRALVELTHLFLPGMIERKQGFVLNVSSTASYFPIPYSSVYAASKAFVTSFSEALWLETKNSGVQILNLCPGLTKTDFGLNAGIRDFHKDPMAQPVEKVVETAMRALGKTSPGVISGWTNKLMVLAARFLPHRIILELSLMVQNSRGRV